MIIIVSIRLTLSKG